MHSLRIINVTARTIQNHLNDARKVLDALLNLTGLEVALRLEELGWPRPEVGRIARSVRPVNRQHTMRARFREHEI